MQAMLWHSLGRALLALWQQCLLRGARLRRGARAILHDRRPAKMVCDCVYDGTICLNSAHRTQGFLLDWTDLKPELRRFARKSWT